MREAVRAWELLPRIRELYSRLPDTAYLQPWELQHVLWSLGYTDALEDEHEIAAACEGARLDRGEGSSAA